MDPQNTTADILSPAAAWDARLNRVEEEARRLNTEIANLRRERESERQRADEERNAFAPLREAVVRYAVACGAVDVQVAMLRARPDGRREEEAQENLQRAMEEQNAASEALRALARTLQQKDRS